MEAMHDVHGPRASSVVAFSKALAAVSFVAVFCLCGTSAFGEDFELNGGVALAVPSSTSFGNSFDGLEPNELLDIGDSFSFAVLSDSTVSVLIDSILNVSMLALTLFVDDGTDTVFASGTTQIAALALLTGDYRLAVAGLATGLPDGSQVLPNYGGTIVLADNTQVAAIPEPEIYAMMAVGIGVMGWAARRKKRKQKVI